MTNYPVIRLFGFALLLAGLGFAELRVYQFPQIVAPIVCQELNVSAVRGPGKYYAVITSTVCDGFGGSSVASVRVEQNGQDSSKVVFKAEDTPAAGETNAEPSLEWVSPSELKIIEARSHQIFLREDEVDGVKISLEPR